MKILSSVVLIAALVIGCRNTPQPPASETPIEMAPQWAKEVVWYQIFPERFRNGDSGNDPTLDDMAGGWPYKRPENWQLHPWTSDWYKLQPWETTTGEGFYWETGLRRYGGDLQGVMDKLDYLQDLGITALYFNPLFEAPSLHKYDATMYHHIDNNFGPDPQGDRAIWAQEDPADPATWQWTSADSLFLRLIGECHRRGIRVIIDGVFNHVGNTFWAFQDVVQNQQNSPYADWFIINAWDDPETPDNEFDYAGWYGVRDLPEIREDENGLVSGFREHVHAIVRRWMDPNGDGDPSDGIDGWRLDVAEMVSKNFWRDFRKWVRDINPEAYLTGEVWWEDWPNNKIFNAAPWLQGDVFDAVMNYRFAQATKQFIIDQNDQIAPSAFVEKIMAVHRDYPEDKVYALQNLMDSHDVDRLASQIVNPDRWYDHGAHPGQNPDYDIRRPNAEERLRQNLIIAIQMTMPGAPMIYYGDEAGMWGGDDPDCRKPMVWPDMTYEPEAAHPLGKERPVDPVFFENEVFDWYKKMIAIRNGHNVLALGDIEFFHVDDSTRTLGYRRSLDGTTMYIILNNNATETAVYVDLPGAGSTTLQDAITETSHMVEAGRLSLQLAPYQAVILHAGKS